MKTHYTHHPGPTRIEYNTADLPRYFAQLNEQVPFAELVVAAIKLARCHASTQAYNAALDPHATLSANALNCTPSTRLGNPAGLSTIAVAVR